MAEKRPFASFFLDVLRNIISPQNEATASPTPVPEKKKLSLKELPLDELEKAKAMLDHEERKVLAELEDIDKRKRLLYEKGVNGNISEHEQLIIARKIKDLDLEANSKSRELQVISKESRTINGLVLLKKNTLRATESATSKVLGNLDLSDLTSYISQATVDNEFNMKKFDEVLRELGIVDSIAPEFTEDRDVLEIMKMMQKARAAGEQDIDTSYDEFNKATQKMHERQVEDAEKEI